MSKFSDQVLEELRVGRPGSALSLAEVHASEGDGDTLQLMALWRLAGSALPRDLPEARKLLRLAAEAGNADAALMEVALVANGSGGEPDWQGAHRLLREAAARWGGAAVEHLALLEEMDLAPSGDPSHLPEPELLSASPRVLRWRSFLTPTECAHIALSAQDILEPSMVADPRTGKLMPHPIRTSAAAPLGPTRETLPIQAILRRIAAATETDVRQGESLTVLHYAPGQQYRMHMDGLPHEENQRIATVILYLNEGYSGGETCFEASGLKVAGRGGDAVFFSNATAQGEADPLSRHASLPVREGAKWVATRWIRAHDFDVWRGR